MNDEVKIVNEFDRDGHHFKIGVNADGQVSIYIDDETKAHSSPRLSFSRYYSDSEGT